MPLVLIAGTVVAKPKAQQSANPLNVWAAHVARCARNIIIARPAESRALLREEVSELCAA
jgi:hypothetical protein